jgi:hypothetical protein
VWRQLPALHRRWIVVNALVATAAINLVFNAAIDWLSVKGEPTVPLWGMPLVETSAFSNLVGTLFLLPLITCVLMTRVVRRDVRLGSLDSLSQLRTAYGWLGALPTSPLRRGVVFGAIAVAVLAPPLALALGASSVPELSQGEFVVSHAVFAAALSVVVAPVIALYAMADPADGLPVEPALETR